MTESLSHEFRRLLPAGFVALLLSVLAIFLWHSDDGRAVTMGCYFVGCSIMGAAAFRPNSDSPLTAPYQIWRRKMLALSLVLSMGFAVFSALFLMFADPHDLAAFLVALLAIVPALCITPYLVLATRKPVVAVIFTLMLVLAMKLLGCIVVVLVYGWHADNQGQTDMPWLRPNLLVWLFWINTALLSGWCFRLSAKKFGCGKPMSNIPGAQ